MNTATLYLTFLSPFRQNIPPVVPNKHTIPSSKRLDSILDILAQTFSEIRIVGGDPLLLPNAPALLMRLGDLFDTIHIETYGSNIFRAGYVIKDISTAGVNIDVTVRMLDPNPQITDSFLGPGAWEYAIGAITLLDATYEIRPNVAIYVGKHSTHSYNFLLGLGYKIILRRAYGMEVTPRSVATMFMLGEKYPEHFIVEDYVYRAITAGERWLGDFVVDFDGNVYIHPYILKPITNILEDENFMDTFHNRVEAMIAKRLAGKCAKCAYAGVCGGGDPFYWKKSIQDVVCPIKEQAEEEIISEEEQVEEVSEGVEEAPEEL